MLLFAGNFMNLDRIKAWEPKGFDLVVVVVEAVEGVEEESSGT